MFSFLNKKAVKEIQQEHKKSYDYYEQFGFKLGGSFEYMGIIFYVKSLCKLIYVPHGFAYEPSLLCEYFDKNGVIHEKKFTEFEAIAASKQNNLVEQ